MSDNIWFWCGNYTIVCLDANTGNLKYSWQPFKGVFEDGQFYFNFPYFDEENCKVLLFERSYFIECDLQTQTTHIIWQDDKVNLNIIACSFTSDFLYFVAANRGRVVDRILGVFDRRSNKIVWQEELHLGNGIALKEPQVNGDKVYVLDTGGTLHIYKKS